MKKIPQVLVDELSREMRKTKLSRKDHVEWFKWIRYYLDFCFKYQHSTRNPDTELLYLQKLSSKGQTHSQQAQASETIALFRHAAKRFPATGQEQDQVQQPNDWGQVLIQLEQVLRVRQCAQSTSKNYRLWMLQFQEFLDSKPVAEVIDDDAAEFLTHLAVKKHVMASTQNQAFNALLFLFRHVLKRRFELRGRVQRARRTRYVPVVLSREEVDVMFSHMEDPHRLIAQLLYGCGLRLNVTLNLRVEQVDLPQRRVTIHRGKGRKDRSMPLPLSIIKRLEQHLDQVKSSLIRRMALPVHLLRRGVPATGMAGAFPGACSLSSRRKP